MRILIAHNTYRYSGGEDVVVNAEREMLLQQGHEVMLYERDNHDLEEMSRLGRGLNLVWSSRTTNDIRALVAKWQPDVLHVHNVHALISPSLYWAAFKAGVPVVQTLHNFRLLCPQATFLRAGEICTDCVGKLPWRSVARKCYRDSAVESAAVTAGLGVHRMLGTYGEKVSRFIALTEFGRGMFIEGGLPAEKILVKPNFVGDAGSVATDNERKGLIFVGRLSQEKGIHTLLAASTRLPLGALRVAGHGPLKSLVNDALPASNVLGKITPERILSEMRNAVALVVPSICLESFGLVVAEAYSAGLPVIASRLGALGELVEDGVTGLLVEAGNSEALARAMQWALNHPSEMAQMGANGRRRYELLFSAGQNYKALMAIYEDARKAALGPTHSRS
jgi:glycosyltransferase involved in cell wall biosynthesis